jgi:hypothetical protein
MHMVDIKMSAASSAAEIWSRPDVASKQSRLNVLIQVFRELHPKYDGVHSISKTIRYFMECVGVNEPTQMMITNDQSDVLARSPAQYLRLALTIDVCLSQDRLVQDSDFPAALRRYVNMNQSLMPILLGQPSIPIPMQMTRPVVLPRPASPRPLSPNTYAKSFSRWMEDDPTVSFALQMGIDVGTRPQVVQEVTARAQKAYSDSTEETETSPSDNSQVDSSQGEDEQVDETIDRTSDAPIAGMTEDLLQRLQGAINWAQNDQSLSFAQDVGLFPEGMWLNQGYL